MSIDYEAFSPENVGQHAEYSVLGRTPTGLVLVVAHPHTDTIAVLNQREPGFFVAAPKASPFPMAISIAVPEPGRLSYNWHFAAPSQEMTQRDTAELSLLR